MTRPGNPGSCGATRSGSSSTDAPRARPAGSLRGGALSRIPHQPRFLCRRSTGGVFGGIGRRPACPPHPALPAGRQRGVSTGRGPSPSGGGRFWFTLEAGLRVAAKLLGRPGQRLAALLCRRCADRQIARGRRPASRRFAWPSTNCDGSAVARQHGRETPRGASRMSVRDSTGFCGRLCRRMPLIQMPLAINPASRCLPARRDLSRMLKSGRPSRTPPGHAIRPWLCCERTGEPRCPSRLALAVSCSSPLTLLRGLIASPVARRRQSCHRGTFAERGYRTDRSRCLGA